ncbi:MAG: YlxM family DNA-binding protein [Clostridiales bacterium]|nr:YlxM family DNA-binding protein [Clostridiales bacterium]
MEKNVRMAILFDYYGAMLTEKQREYFDLYYGENLSLSEIAENDGISRQGVRDVIVRAEAILEDSEEKLGMIRQHQELEAGLAEIETYLAEIAQLNSTRFKNGRLLELCNLIDEKLQLMKD